MSPPDLKQRAKNAIKALVDNRLVYYHLARDPNSVMLTFDDGPDPRFTPRILDLLDQHDARGVFFLIGEFVEKEPDLVREIHRRGHVLGNHTYSHLDDYRGGTYSMAQCLDEVRRCQDLIRSLTGVDTHLFRPPRGELNSKSIGTAFRTRHRVVHWSLEGGEWGDRTHASGSQIAEFVVQALQPRDIVLLHDDSEKTLEVLESLLPLAAQRGYDLKNNALMGRVDPS